MKEDTKNIIKAALIFTLIILSIILLAGIMIVSISNNAILERCQILSINRNVVFQEGKIIDTCLIVEDNEELTYNKWVEKHKYDGMEVRK